MKIQPLHRTRPRQHQKILNPAFKQKSFGRLASGMLASGVMALSSLGGLLGGAAALHLILPSLILSSLIEPPAARAYTAADLLTVSWVAGEDYTALARRAEYAARTNAQQRFDADILLTRVVITVLGQNGGQTAPILVMDVGRTDWRNRPDPRYWSKYYRSTAILLGLEGVPATGTLQPAQPAGVIQPTPSPLPSPAPTPTNPVAPLSPDLAPNLNVPQVPGTPSENPDPSSGPTEPPAESPAEAPIVTPSRTPRPSSTRRSPGRSVRDQSAPPSSTGSDTGSEPSSQNNPPPINIPATPAGEVGLPSSVIR